MVEVVPLLFVVVRFSVVPSVYICGMTGPYSGEKRGERGEMENGERRRNEKEREGEVKG
jgi:hypothetical protein